jgi:hypothetical protein
MLTAFRSGSMRTNYYAKETELLWSILWDTRDGSDTTEWNVAHAEAEAGALERAEHFLKLGFPVYAIRSPTGAVFMDQEQLIARFGGARVAPDPGIDREPAMTSMDD